MNNKLSFFYMQVVPVSLERTRAKTSLLFNRTMEQISDNARSISLTYQDCHFSKIARKIFTKFRSVKNVEFYNSEFEEIQEGAFDFIASDISLKIEGSTKPFKLNQDVFVDFKVSNFVLKDVKLQEFTKEALQGFNYMNENSKLVLDNVAIMNPSYGALSAKIPNFEFNRIEIDGKCECEETARKLTSCTRGRFNQEKDCEYLVDQLINSMICKVCGVLTKICTKEFPLFAN